MGQESTPSPRRPHPRVVLEVSGEPKLVDILDRAVQFVVDPLGGVLHRVGERLEVARGIGPTTRTAFVIRPFYLPRRQHTSGIRQESTPSPRRIVGRLRAELRPLVPSRGRQRAALGRRGGPGGPAMASRHQPLPASVRLTRQGQITTARDWQAISGSSGPISSFGTPAPGHCRLSHRPNRSPLTVASPRRPHARSDHRSLIRRERRFLTWP